MSFLPSIIIVFGILLFVGFRGGYFKSKSKTPVSAGMDVNMQAAMLVRDTLRKNCTRCFYLTRQIGTARTSKVFVSLVDAGFAPTAVRIDSLQDIRNFLQRHGRGLHLMLVFDKSLETTLITTIEDTLNN